MKNLKLICIFLMVMLLCGCVFNDPKYINLSSKSTPYYYSNEIYKKLKNNDKFSLKVFDVNFYEHFDVVDEDNNILIPFLESLNTDNYIPDFDLNDETLKYRLLIEFSDSKFVINVYSKDIISIFPWDGNMQEDIISMDNVPKYNNIYYFCQYIINKAHSKE